MDKQLANVQSEGEVRDQTRMEQVLEQLASLQASADAANEHNQVSSACIVYY